ncbi:MAG TPA: hypothetical protein VMR74_01425 [Gammaproteobacteria bacterium]|nr:hypothetical protein [Gammaproteobacteria bacterium]
MSSTPSFWLPSLALVAIAMAAPAHEAAAQLRRPATPPPDRARPATPPAETAPATPAPGRTTTPGASSGPGGLQSTIITAPVAAKVYALPTISYGEPMPPPTRSLAFDARLPQFENLSVAATVNGRSVNRQLVVLNGREGIENAPIREDARRLLAMHVGKLNLSESTVYFFDPQVASAWLDAHPPVPPEVGAQEEEEEEDDSDCGDVSFNGIVDCGEDAVENFEDEYERARERAQDWYDDSSDDLADLWDEALNCFSDHVLPGVSVPVRFDITPAMTVNLSQSASRGSASGNVTGSVGLGIPMDGDLQAKVDFFYIPCLPFVVRPRSVTVTGDLTVGEVLAIQATATGAFNQRYTIPPTGGPRIPIQVIPIIIGGVPVAIIDVSAYIEGEIEVTANGSVVGNATLSNEHRSTFDFTCDGHGCKSGPGGRPTASTPVTTTQSVQIEGKVTAKPGIYTALMVTLNANVLGARLGPQPFLEGTAVGCGAATATQTNGDQSAGDQNAALAADLDWGVDFRAEALVGGKVVGNSYRQEITGENHIWFKDLIPGGSSALRAAMAGPAEAATGQPTAYKLSVPSCYPYDEDAKYRVTWTGDATPSATPASACQWQSGGGDCQFDPTRELDLRFAWPAAGNYSLTAALIGDEHRTFDPAPLATEFAVAVTGEPSTTTGGGAGGGAAGPTADRGQRGGSSTGPTVDRGGSGSACCDIVPNPAMRGRLGRVVVAYPEEVSPRIDVFRAGETRSVAGGYGDAAFDLLPGNYDVTISGKRVTGVTVRSGNDTKIRVGVLHVTASDGTRVDLVDQADGRSLIGGYGTDAYGLPIGEVGVQIAGQTEAVVIEAGQVTDF